MHIINNFSVNLVYFLIVMQNMYMPQYLRNLFTRNSLDGLLLFVLLKAIYSELGVLLVVGRLLPPCLYLLDFYRPYDGQRIFSLGNGQH